MPAMLTIYFIFISSKTNLTCTNASSFKNKFKNLIVTVSVTELMNTHENCLHLRV